MGNYNDKINTVQRMKMVIKLYPAQDSITQATAQNSGIYIFTAFGRVKGDNCLPLWKWALQDLFPDINASYIIILPHETLTMANSSMSATCNCKQGRCQIRNVVSNKVTDHVYFSLFFFPQNEIDFDIYFFFKFSDFANIRISLTQKKELMLIHIVKRKSITSLHKVQ